MTDITEMAHTDPHGRRLLFCNRCLDSHMKNEDWEPRQAITISPEKGAVCLYHFLGNDIRVDI